MSYPNERLQIRNRFRPVPDVRGGVGESAYSQIGVFLPRGGGNASRTAVGRYLISASCRSRNASRSSTNTVKEEQVMRPSLEFAHFVFRRTGNTGRDPQGPLHKTVPIT